MYTLPFRQLSSLNMLSMAQQTKLTALADETERNRMLAEMAEQSTDMISRHSPDRGCFIYASPAITHLLGYSVEEIIGVSAFDLYHPDDVENFKRRTRNVNYSRGLYTHTYRFRSKSGEYIWLESTSRTIRDKYSGKIKEILVVSRDISHRILADQTNRRLVQVMESTSDMVIFASLQHQVKYINEAARSTLALQHKQPENLSLSELFPAADYQQLLQHALVQASLHGSWRGELHMYSLNAAAPIPVSLEVLAHMSMTAELEYFSLVAHDLTEARAAEAKLLQYQTEINHAGRLVAMGELASSLAHELNQPLTAIVNYLRGIERRFGQDERTAWADIEYPIKKATSTALRAGEIIHRMMDFTRKREPFKKERFGLGDVIEDLIEFCHPKAKRQHVRFSTHIPADLPLVETDRIQVEQVLLNLMVNAIEAYAEHTGPLDKVIHITVSQYDAAHLQVQVKDFGMGLPTDVETVFERFFTTKSSGLGIGLAISRSLIETLGGELWAEHNPEGGTSFYFTLMISI
ncbi:MAG: PAS domain S-box protein [Neisseriaceae bacterium]|nr:PAS domain S-box protein [Neisseriaceae bacterium]